MIISWNDFAAKLDRKGEKIEAAVLQLAAPKLEGLDTIVIQLPNQTTLDKYETKKALLLQHLKIELRNSNISIEAIVNEEVAKQNAYTDEDKFSRLKKINPNLELLQKLFDLYY